MLASAATHRAVAAEMARLVVRPMTEEEKAAAAADPALLRRPALGQKITRPERAEPADDLPVLP
jgi:hypothetical protein